MDIIQRLHIPSDRVRTIYLGVTEQFRRISDESALASFRQRYQITTPVLLYLGTIQPRKNVDVIIQAFAHLKRERHIPHQLYIVGRRGWLTEGLEALVARLDIQRDVVFTGAVPDGDLPLFFNVADVFIDPSSYEGFGLTLLEAMACGTPVVTSAISSIPEVVGEAALTVTPTDAREVADAVDRLLTNPPLRARCIEQGLERARLFRWRATAEQTLELYNELAHEQ
jgi:glycosyltransferase involved in cell wall biosynthesis